jgi:hypothetical protein
MNPFVYLLLLLAVILVAACIRIVPESERCVVFVLGRFAGIRGPGVLLQLPGTAQTLQRVKLGDRGEMMAPEIVRTNGIDVPAVNKSGARLGTKVWVTGFADGALEVMPDPTLTHKVVCPRCAHEFDV